MFNAIQHAIEGTVTCRQVALESPLALPSSLKHRQVCSSAQVPVDFLKGSETFKLKADAF